MAQIIIGSYRNARGEMVPETRACGDEAIRMVKAIGAERAVQMCDRHYRAVERQRAELRADVREKQ